MSRYQIGSGVTSIGVEPHRLDQTSLRTPTKVLTIHGAPLMIAISYRREDSLPITGRLYDRLQSEFGRDSVFMDFDSIPYGVDFRDHIKQMIDRSKVLIAVIGPDWVGRRRHRGRRIDEPNDFVRLEIASALELKLPIIPILVGNTQMPRSEELPKDIEALAFRNGLRLDVGIDFHHHAERLSAAINRILTASEPPKPAEPEKPQIVTPPPEPSPQVPPIAKQPPTEPEKAPQISPAPEAPRQPSEESSEAMISQPARTPPETTLKQTSEPIVKETPKPLPKTPTPVTPPPSSKGIPEEIEKPKPSTSPSAEPIPPKEIPETIAKSTPPPEPPKPPKKLPTPIVPKPPTAAKSARTSSFHKVLSRLQERLMADYIPGGKFAAAPKKIWGDWNSKKITGIAFFFVALAIVGIGIWYLEAFQAKPAKLAQAKPNEGNQHAATPPPSTDQSSPPFASPTVPPSTTTSPSTHVAPSAPTASASGSPTTGYGTLRIDSSPWGITFEVIDAKGSHHTGVTPAAVYIAVGPAEVIYKSGNQEHRETVLVGSGAWPSIGWVVPEQSPATVAENSNTPTPTIAPASPTPAQSPARTAPRISQISASSELKSQDYQGKWKSYGASLAFDGKNDTAWCSNGGGPGDWIMVRFESPTNIRGVSVYSGYGIDTNRYKTNNRVRVLRVSFSDGTTQDLDFEDRMTIQRFQFPHLVTTESAKFEIVAVYRGTRYNSTPISEIQFDYATDTLAIQPTPTPTVSSTNENVKPWQDRISDFVKQFVAVNQQQDANATVDFYAPSVDYFGNRGRDHAFILRDVQKYNGQWPARRDSIDGDIHVEERIPNQQYGVSFKLNFYAEDPKANDWSKGQVATTLDVRIIDGAPKIAAINQKRLQRQSGKGKGPRPADMPAPEPPGPITPTKLTKIIVKKYGFSAMLPQELFPDAEAKLGDGATDHLTSLKGCATVIFSAPQENVRKVFDDYVNQFQSATDHRTIDYKVVKETWFAVSGSSKTTGYYVKGVRHDNAVFVMELDYAGAVCRIPASMVAQMSHAFDGTVQNPPAGTTTNQPPNVQGSASPPSDDKTKALTKIYVKKYGVSVLLPTEIFPEETKLSTGQETQLTATDGLTTLEFYDSNDSLAKNYRSRIAESPETRGRTIDYKILKENWFVVSGKFAPDAKHAAEMGFYTKGIKKGHKVILMHVRFKEEDPLIGEEVLTAMSRGFEGN